MGVLSWVGRRFGLGAGDAQVWRAAFGTDTHAGKPVTPDTAMQVSTVWACIRLISETVATLPLGVYRRDGDGRKHAETSHALYPLLHDAPNADFTAVEFWEGVCSSLCLWGNAYAEVERSGNRIVAISLLKPELMAVERRPDGRLRYNYSGNPRREYDEDDVFHVRGFGVGLDVGLSPIAYARHSLGLAMAMDETAARMFASGMHASGILKTDQVLKPEQRKQLQTMLDSYAGSEKAGKQIVLEAGLTWEQLTINPDDAQMLQSRAFSVEEICRWFRVPPFMIGHTEKSTSWGTGLEQQNIAFLTYALRPYLTRIEQAVKRQLLRPQERGTIYAEYNLEGLLRADSAGRAALYSTFAQNGINTRNEIRARENLPPVDGGDLLTVQSNLVPLNMLGGSDAAQLQARAALRSWLGIEERGEADAS